MMFHSVLERGRSVLRSQILAHLIGLVFLFGAAPASAQLACSIVTQFTSYVCFDVSAVGTGLHVNEVQFEISNNGPPPGITFPYQNDAAMVLVTCPVSTSPSSPQIHGRWYNVAAWMPWSPSPPGSQGIPLPCAPREDPGGGGLVLEFCPEGPNPTSTPLEEECENTNPSPILLDLDRNQFHLSGEPVYFDIDADGQPEPITWVSPGTQDAFLFLDRNANGVVDDGSELFGNATMLFSGEQAEQGYEALAEFDLVENGGNQDGVIDDADSIFSDLKVWIDGNANGNHESYESQSLAEAGVLTIGLDYRESRRTDSHGNEFRYIGSGSIEVNGKSKKMATTDVFFKIL